MLLVVAHVRLRHDGEGLDVAAVTWPSVRDLGFADASGDQIGSRPPRPAKPPYAKAGFCEDRFLHMSSGPTSSLATVQVREQFVYDGHYRGEIAFIGLGVAVTLREDAFRSYWDYLADAARGVAPDERWPSLRVMIRLPVGGFRFPPSRGSDTPWSTPLEALAPLRTVAREEVDALDVVLLEDRRYDRPLSGEIPIATEPLRLRRKPV